MNDITVINIDVAKEPRKARATKRGKVHYAYGNMSLCMQYVGDNVVEDRDVDCKRCINNINKSNNIKFHKYKYIGRLPIKPIEEDEYPYCE